MSENLIDGVIKQFSVFRRSTYDSRRHLYLTKMYHNTFIAYAIVPDETGEHLRMRFDVFRRRPDYGTYDSYSHVPIHSHIVGIEDKLIARFLIRRCRTLLEKLSFKNINVIENENEQQQYTITLKDNGVSRPTYMYMIPCLAYLINNDAYIKQLMDVSFEYEISSMAENRIENVRINVYIVRISRAELMHIIDTFDMNVYEELP